MLRRDLIKCLLSAFCFSLLSIPLAQGSSTASLNNSVADVGMLLSITTTQILVVAGVLILGLVLFIVSRKRKESSKDAGLQIRFPKSTPKTDSAEVRYDHQVESGILLLSQVNKLGYLKMLETGNVSPKMRQSDVIEFIEEVYASFKTVSDLLNVEFNLINRSENIVMDIDKDLLVIALGNLFSQAFENLVDPYYLTAEVDYVDNNLRIKVTKHGSKVDVPSLDYLVNGTDVLYDKDPSNCQIRLRTTALLTRLMGGNLSLQESLNGGIVHVIELPVRAIAPREENEEVLNAAEHWKNYLDQINQFESTSENAKDGHLLIIENSIETAAFTAFCLGDQVNLHYASSLSLAREYLVDVKPDLIVSNSVISDGNFEKFYDELKNESQYSDIPVIVLSSQNDVDHKLDMLSLGVDAYLEKPINHKELLIRIQRLLAKSEKLKDKTLNIPEASKFSYPLDLGDADYVENEFIQRAKAVIDENLFDPQFGLELFSVKMNMSQSQLRRKIFSLSGLTPVRFIRQHRIGKAIELLKSQELNISQIAYDTGFSDPKYFSRVFTKEIGLSPSEFKNKIKRNLLLF